MASRSQTEQQQQQGTQDLATVLEELGNKVERLKVLYEQYFMGIEKMEPQVARKDVTRVMLGLQQQYIRNTALRFKFNTMLQKWNIYITYWNRTLREIENGTYQRHLAKARRKAEREGRELPAEMRFNKVRPPSGSFSLDEETKEGGPKFTDVDTGVGKSPLADVGDLEEFWDRIAPTETKKGATVPPAPATAKPKGPPPPPTAKGPPPVPGAKAPPPRPAAPPTASSPSTASAAKIPGMNEAELRALHRRYVDAQKAAGAAGQVKYETLVASLAKQVPKVLEQPGVKGVRFDVSVQNGKPILKAIPQK